MMHEPEKSDPAEVARKRANATGRPDAECVERRAGAERNASEDGRDRTPSRATLSPGIERVRQAAQDRKLKSTALLHHVDVELLRGAFFALKRDAAPGVDGVTWDDYAAGLDDKLVDLHGRVHRGAYRARPSRRQYIPKPDGRQRPLGIAALKDKIVQRALAATKPTLDRFPSENLVKDYVTGPRFSPSRRTVHALRGVSLTVARGESFGIVGESGSGKTTLSRCILQLERATSGRILYDGTDLTALSGARLRDLRARIQIVFQDPYASLNPRMTVHDIVAEPMVIHAAALGLDAAQRTARVRELLDVVGLGAEHLYRYPHEFSGGQRQRVGIARALSPKPDFLILDEPTSALDVSVQAQVLNLLHDLQRRFGLTYLFISHDLGVIRYICDRVALLYAGEIVEEGPTSDVFDAPRSDYGRMLLAALPEPDPDLSPYRAAP